ncbi:MAG TPA: hypothetical protein VIG30_15060 [Ktedonobacterales bacterium]
MSNAQTTAAPEAPQAVVAAPGATGDWLTQTARLMRWNLFQIWHRTLTRVLLGVMAGLYLLTLIGVTILLAASENMTGGPGIIGEQLRTYVTYPQSITTAAGYITFMGVVMACIVVGSLVGGEYNNSTQRLALSRGVGRGQALAAQVAAVAVLSLAVVGGAMLLGLLAGLIIGSVVGGDIGGFSLGGLGQLLGFWGAVSFRVFDYSLIALFLATLGRSTAAGVGGALGFIVVEPIVVTILTAVVLAQRIAPFIGRGGLPSAQLNGIGQTLTNIINGFLQTNANALAQTAQQGPLPLTPAISTDQVQNLIVAPPGGVQAFVVMLVYAAALIGLSYLLVRTRDVTD